MVTQVVRRLYRYIAAFIGLLIGVIGARNLLSALLDQLFAPISLGTPTQATLRLSGSLALLLVGLPVWFFHWSLAQRSLTSAEERHAIVRRLYGYGVLVVRCQ